MYRKNRLFILMVAVMLVLAPTAQAVVLYKLTEIEPFPNQDNYLYGNELLTFNNTGKIAGVGIGVEVSKWFRFTATGINASDQVVGNSDSINAATAVHTKQAFIVSPNKILKLGADKKKCISGGGWEDFISSASGINDKGQVTGLLCGADGQRRAFVTINGIPKSLGTIKNGSNFSPTAINNQGQVVGHFSVPGFNSQPIKRPFVTIKGVMKQISAPSAKDKGLYHQCWGPSVMLPPKENDSVATAINDKGQVAGVIYGRVNIHHNLCDEVMDTSVAAVTVNGVMTPIANTSYATDLNNKGQVVGWTDHGLRPETLYPPTARHAFVTLNGKATDLNSLVDKNTRWSLLKAHAINDKGQIIGEGVNALGAGGMFLLSPIKPQN